MVTPVLVNGEFQFEDLRFGTLDSGYPLTPGGYVVGDTTYRTEDINEPYGNGVLFGRDYINPVTYTFTLQIFEEGDTRWADAAEAIAAFRKAWRTAVEVNRPGGVHVLYMYHGYQLVMVFGRPRGFAVNRAALRQGAGVVSVMFTAPDDRVFNPAQGFAMNIVPPSTGGLTAPLTAPLTTTGTGAAREGTFQVGGDGDAPLSITFNGPVVNPAIDFSNQFSVGLTTQLLEGQSVVIDAMSRTVLRNDGASLAGALTRNSPDLSALALPPGNHIAMFRGTSSSGLSTAEIEWYPVGYSS